MNFDIFVKGIQAAAANAEQTIKGVGSQVGEAVNQAQKVAAPVIESAAEVAGHAAQQAYTTTQQGVGTAASFVKEQAAVIGEHAGGVIPVDEIGRKIASLGTPAIFFAVASSIAGGMGLAGGAVVTTALAMLGGPFGMVGGLVALGVLTLIADAVSKYGIEAVLIATFNARREQGVALEEIHQEIDSLWLSDELKLKLKQQFVVR